MALTAHQTKVKNKLLEIMPSASGSDRADVWVTDGSCMMAKVRMVDRLGELAYNTYIAESTVNEYLLLAEACYLAYSLPLQAFKIQIDYVKAAPTGEIETYGLGKMASATTTDINQMRQWWLEYADSSISQYLAQMGKNTASLTPTFREVTSYYA